MTDELQTHLEGEPVDYSVFTIENLESANRAMRKLAAAQKRIDEKRALALSEAARISEWCNAATKSDVDTVRFFENSLKAYVIKLREETHGETKSLSLPDGEVSSRTINAKAGVADKDLFLKWCENNERGQWVRVTLSPDLSALKGEVEFSGDLVVDSLTGEAIDGLVAIEADIAVSVKLAKDV